jgi:hypothetical protein
MWEAGTTYQDRHYAYQYIGTRHHLTNFIPNLLAVSEGQRHQIYHILLKVIIHKLVSDRPQKL